MANPPDDDDGIVKKRPITQRYPWPHRHGPTCVNWPTAGSKPKPVAMFCDDPNCNQYLDLVDDLFVAFEEVLVWK